jgi:hypothetical protein
MSAILVRGLDPETIERLKARAKRNGRSLQSELKILVERAAGVGGDQVGAVLGRWQKRFAGRKLARSVRLIREDRGR